MGLREGILKPGKGETVAKTSTAATSAQLAGIGRISRRTEKAMDQNYHIALSKPFQPRSTLECQQRKHVRALGHKALVICLSFEAEGYRVDWGNF
jgi:hypothetical protein